MTNGFYFSITAEKSVSTVYSVNVTSDTGQIYQTTGGAQTQHRRQNQSKVHKK